MFFYVILAIHSVLCLSLIGLVLLQQGKGADAGATFGGNSNSVLGAGGAGDILTKMTTGLAVSFMITSILLVRSYNSVGVIPRISAPTDVLEGSLMQEEAMQEGAGLAGEATSPVASGKVLEEVLEEQMADAQGAAQEQGEAGAEAAENVASGSDSDPVSDPVSDSAGDSAAQ